MCVKEPWHNRACFLAWSLLAFIQGIGAVAFSLAVIEAAAAFQANKNSSDSSQRQLAYFSNPLAGIYTVLALGSTLVIACLCGVLGLHKRSVVWMNWCNRFVSLVCLFEFLAWILLLIFGIPSATSKTFHKFYFGFWNSTVPPDPTLPHPTDLEHALANNLVSSAVFIFCLFIFHGSFAYYNTKITHAWIEADHRAAMDKKTAQLQAAPGAAHTELAGAASARQRCDDVDHVDDGCDGGDDGGDGHREADAHVVQGQC